MYSVLNTVSEYIYFQISKNITSYSFLLVFKIVESLHCILNPFMTEAVIVTVICSANQCTGFYMITASVMKGLRKAY